VWRGLIPVLLVVLAGGCDSETSQLAPVRGTITFQGTPLREGTVVFIPDPLRGGDGPMARAEIQSDGSFVLRTGDAPGAVPGWHRVTVVAMEEFPPPPGGPPFGTRRSLLPVKYRDPEQSGLSFHVLPGQANVWNVNLE
jgi:hypothetical protein